jgi:RNA polymerase sigma factor (sigma-70 family)
MMDSLHRRYHVDLLKALRRRFGVDHDGLEDAIQTAFLRFGDLAGRRSIRDPRAFVLVMARNLILNQMRHAAVAQRALERETQAPSLPILEERTPESVLLERERHARLNQAILDLPDEERSLLVMSRIEGMTYDEISKRTGRSQADISRRISRALSTLKARMAAELDRGVR